MKPDHQRRVRIGGVPFDALNEHEVIEFICSRAAAGRGGWLVNPNVDVLEQVSRDGSLVPLISKADLCVADGAPVVWSSVLMRRRLPSRVPGSQLIWSLSSALADRGLSVYLLGARPEATRGACLKLTAKYPHLVIAGCSSPSVADASDPSTVDALASAVAEAEPSVVFMAFGFPKQERLMAQLARRFPSTWFIGSGASIDMAAGLFRRAPYPFQMLGLEWLWRLLLEPRRLGGRYLRRDLPFALSLLIRSAAVSRPGHAREQVHRG